MLRCAILLLHFCLLTFSVFAQYSDSIYTRAERMPYFPGCTAYQVGSEERRQCSNQTVKAYIFNHIIYPQAAKEANIEGAVYIRFVVDEMGQIQQPTILKDIGGGCGEAALSVVQNMPRWEPAFHQGKKVKVALDLPIHFYFKDSSVDLGEGYTLTWGNLTNASVSKKSIRKTLNEAVQVFDSNGKPMTISELRFSYTKNNKLIQKASNGTITPAMEKLVRKMKKSGQLTIIATVQKEGQFIEVAKAYSLIR